MFVKTVRECTKGVDIEKLVFDKKKWLKKKIIIPSSKKIQNEPKNWPKHNRFTGCAAGLKKELSGEISTFPPKIWR